jgi:3-hydroxybutyrate dehydrogenase
MSQELQGKSAFVTGGASGIGLAIGRELHEAGAKVALADKDGAGAARAAQELGAGALGLGCDVTDEAGLRKALAEAAKAHGPIDILVNNAGIQHVTPIEEFPIAKFEFMFRLMVVAPLIALQEVLPGMKQRRWGRVLSIASINGLVGFAGKAGYNTAKHGLLGLTKVAALEAAPFGSVTVNALCPGYVDTPLVRNQLGDLARTRNVPLEKVLEEVIYPLVPMKKLLSVQDVADYARFLCSDKAGCVTGQAVVVDAGYTAQ